MKKVYANGEEILSKKSGVKTMHSVGDVCHTPPPPPPMVAAKIGVPIPYPNFSVAKNLTKGTTTVKIKGSMVSQKNKSYIKKSSGNESATTQFKKGLLDGTIKGKTYATGWSFNVRVQKKNVVRHSDGNKHNVK